MAQFTAVIDALRRAPEIVVPLVREAPAELLKRRPSARRWSIHEHACHLAHVHGLFFDRLDRMLSEPAPVIRPYLPAEQDADDFLLNMQLDESLERYAADRKKLVERLERLSETDWERTAEHPEYRAYSVFIMFRHLALHDFLHAYRIEELLLQRTERAERANAYNFTDRVRDVLAASKNEALRLRHEYVGTEHILLALISEGEGVAAAALRNLGIDAEGIRQTIYGIVKEGRSTAAGPDLPYTSRAKKILELSMAEARDLHHEYVGTEHLFLGLIREEKGIAAQVLLDAGVNLEAARGEVRKLLGLQ